MELIAFCGWKLAMVLSSVGNCFFTLGIEIQTKAGRRTSQKNSAGIQIPLISLMVR